MEHLDDTALVQLMRAGDEQARDQFVRRWHGPCRAVAYAILRHLEDAQDIAQESLLRALCRIGQLSDPRAAGPWVQAIACNLALTHLARRRRQGIRVDIDGIAPLPAPERGCLPDAEALARALADLTEPERAVFGLYVLDGLSHAAIAARRGLSATGSRQLLFQARRKLRESLHVAELSP